MTFQEWYTSITVEGPMEHMMKRAWNAAIAAQLAAPADLLRRLLDDHQRVEPHHADQCALCREAQVAIGGQPAQGGEIDVAEHMAWIARNVKRQEPAQSNSHQIAVKQPAPGERQPSMIASAVYTASGKVFIGSSEE